jgi:AraC-like DNA-binding protein
VTSENQAFSETETAAPKLAPDQTAALIPMTGEPDSLTGQITRMGFHKSSNKISWRLLWAYSRAEKMELRDLCLEKLAAESGLSRGYLSRNFPGLAGQSFKDYRRKRRIAAARKLLIETPMTLEQIAFQLGYAHLEDFTILFEKSTGYKPNAYRQHYVRTGTPPPLRKRQ